MAPKNQRRWSYLFSVFAVLVSQPSWGAEDGPLSLTWSNEMLSIRGAHLYGGAISVQYLEAFCRPGSTRRDWKETVIPRGGLRESTRAHDEQSRTPDGRPSGISTPDIGRLWTLARLRLAEAWLEDRDARVQLFLPRTVSRRPVRVTSLVRRVRLDLHRETTLVVERRKATGAARRLRTKHPEGPRKILQRLSISRNSDRHRLPAGLRGCLERSFVGWVKLSSARRNPLSPRALRRWVAPTLQAGNRLSQHALRTVCRRIAECAAAACVCSRLSSQ